MKITVPLLAAALQLAGIATAQDDVAIAANLERFWSYGRSEPVYPSRKCDSKVTPRLEMSPMTNSTLLHSRNSGLG
jgi:hypothetical protein